MPESERTAQPGPHEITVILRGYLNQQYRDSQRTITLPLAQAASARLVIAHLAIPVGAVGLLFINRQQATLDTPLRAGDTLEILPLLGGG